MKAWVIKRKDGKYYNELHNIFVKLLNQATIYDENGECKCRILITKLADCEPVQVEVKELGNE